MKYDESRLQQACVKWFNYQFPDYRGMLFAIPNGGARSAATGRILKAEGVVAGVADMILLGRTEDYGCLCIEMKTDKGRQQESQKWWQGVAESLGAKYAVCRSLEQFIEVVTEHIKKLEEWKKKQEVLED